MTDVKILLTRQSMWTNQITLAMIFIKIAPKLGSEQSVQGYRFIIVNEHLCAESKF